MIKSLIMNENISLKQLDLKPELNLAGNTALANMGPEELNLEAKAAVNRPLAKPLV